MEWTPGGISSDIEDRRDSSGGGGGFGFGPVHIGCGGLILLGVLSLLFHRNLFTLLSPSDQSAPVTQPETNRAQDIRERPQVEFISFVLDDVQKNWTTILPEQTDRQYRHAKLVLYRDQYPSACGMAETATGPFYCPADEKVYLDLGFFQELSQRFGAPGQFAEAYVIAHELGHHVQKILGIESRVQRLREENPQEANPLSVRLELQADCLAGVWANTTQQRQMIHEEDVESALNAAAAVGDDRLQRMATGRVSPENFTHGSSRQRVQWFREGLETGQTSACNTFRAARQ
ncbi:MAG: neutral zinc metallopeptidase [Acidobacteriaceae bacterium]|nr:neutral zinc metallopeptidase [Acidobacteriaceae bacterium]MBV9501800.1 neutral zinc metallopeptidase [Acidobacteriaceae bacterium]